MGKELVAADTKKLCREDVDLDFLKELENKDLDAFVEIITGQEYDRRWAERLSSHKLYKEHFPDHKKYIEVIIDEIQRFGGNTFANIFRRKGVTYRQILCNVCRKMGIRYSTTNVSTEMMERKLLCEVLIKCLPDMTFADLQRLVEYFNLGLECNEQNVDELIYQITRAFRELTKYDEFAYQMALYMVVDNDVAYQESKEATSSLRFLKNKHIFGLSETCKEDARIAFRNQSRKKMEKIIGSVMGNIESRGKAKQVVERKKSGGILTNILGAMAFLPQIVIIAKGDSGGGEVATTGQGGSAEGDKTLAIIAIAALAVTAVSVCVWFAKPAYRVTIYATFYITFLRLKNKLQSSSADKDGNEIVK